MKHCVLHIKLSSHRSGATSSQIQNSSSHCFMHELWMNKDNVVQKQRGNFLAVWTRYVHIPYQFCFSWKKRKKETSQQKKTETFSSFQGDEIICLKHVWMEDNPWQWKDEYDFSIALFTFQKKKLLHHEKEKQLLCLLVRQSTKVF